MYLKNVADWCSGRAFVVLQIVTEQLINVCHSARQPSCADMTSSPSDIDSSFALLRVSYAREFSVYIVEQHLRNAANYVLVFINPMFYLMKLRIFEFLHFRIVYLQCLMHAVEDGFPL